MELAWISSGVVRPLFYGGETSSGERSGELVYCRQIKKQVAACGSDTLSLERVLWFDADRRGFPWIALHLRISCSHPLSFCVLQRLGLSAWETATLAAPYAAGLFGHTK